MKNNIYLVLTACFLTFVIGVSNFTIAADSLCNNDCTFVLKSGSSGEYQYINQDRANQRMTPWSTFKIPNSLIALDLGVIKSVDEKLSFKTSNYPVQSWWREVWYKAPISLKEAYKVSAVPIYQSTAAKIGADKMTAYLADFNYGNEDISSGVDNFWLNKSMKISAKEQVDFLARLNNGKLKVSEDALQNLKTIMLVEQTDRYKLYAKTGGGAIAKGDVLGWYVGFVKRDNDVYYFALNMNGTSFRAIRDLRIEAAREQLKLAGII